MHTTLHRPIDARPAPLQAGGLRVWLRTQLFGSVGASLATIAVTLLLLLALARVLDWAVFKAVWGTDYAACQQAGGACWSAVGEKFRLIVFGLYPAEAHWRAATATLLLLASLLCSGVPSFWTRWLALLWLLVLACYVALMYGGVLGWSRVETDQWGGLPLTLLLASLSMALAFPLALGVALGRSSDLPVVRTLCAVYVELIRGIPLVSVLFTASFLFPLLMPQGFRIDVLLRVIAGITLFAAAYMAEVIRGGLQAVPAGQREAAMALGLSYWQIQRKVVLPQAIAAVLPGIVNNFISTFKETSLVTVVSLYELTGAMGLAFNSDANWRAFKMEGYLFIALLYFVFCFSLSRYSAWMEKQLRR